jgi:acylphosphatase
MTTTTNTLTIHLRSDDDWATVRRVARSSVDGRIAGAPYRTLIITSSRAIDLHRVVRDARDAGVRARSVTII